MFPTECGVQKGYGYCPQDGSYQEHLNQAFYIELGVLWCWRVVVDQRRSIRSFFAAMTAANSERFRRQLTPDKPHQGRYTNDQRKRRVQGKDGYKRRSRDAPQHLVLQSARPNAMCCLHHDGGDSRLDAVKQASDHGHIAISDIDPGQSDQQNQRGQDKQSARHNAAPTFVHQPSDIGDQLLRFGSGQHHAVIQGMQKPFFRNPPTLFHQLLVHDGNLACRATEADKPKFEPEPKGLGEGDGVWNFK